jgi:hypothetical protein
MVESGACTLGPGVMTVPPLSGAGSDTHVFHADRFHTAPVNQHFTAFKSHSF